MKKIFVLCICIVVLAIVFVFSGKGKYTKVLQDLNVDDLDKIVIYNADVSVTLDQKDDMQKMVDILMPASAGRKPDRPARVAAAHAVSLYLWH